MKVKYLLFMFCLFTIPFMVEAKCSYERVAELSKLASNVNFSYTYEISNGSILFKVNAINIADDIYVKDLSYGTISNGPEFNFNYNKSGVTIRYGIYSKDPNCYGDKLLLQNITLPEYNKFYNTYECREYPQFKYCGVWTDTSNLTTSQFEKAYYKYVSDMEESDDFDDYDEETFISATLKYVSENKVTSGLLIFGLILLPVLIRIKRRIRV